MTGTRRIGILGGTFDPIHVGHLAAGLAARARLGLDEIMVIPAHDPPHRATEPRASGFHRLAMAALAIDEVQGFVVSDMELVRDAPSFTSATLGELHDRGIAAVELFFITGSDAFAEIATWRDYPAIFEMAHFVVISRPAWPLAALRSSFPELAHRMRSVGEGETIGVKPAQAPSPSIFLVASLTPDVSSTEIRSRVGEGRPIAGLVPAAVERHIRRHGLYADSFHDR